MKLILLLLSLVVFGCMVGSEAESQKVIGYPKGRACTQCGKISDTSGFYAWGLMKDSVDTVTFFVYAKVSDLNNRPGFHSSRIGKALSKVGGQAILDAGGQCLTIHQTGKDTVLVEGVKTIVEVPIEPCLPYLLDTDFN